MPTYRIASSSFGWNSMFMITRVDDDGTEHLDPYHYQTREEAVAELDRRMEADRAKAAQDELDRFKEQQSGQDAG
jgi:hypothetical protein